MRMQLGRQTFVLDTSSWLGLALIVFVAVCGSRVLRMADDLDAIWEGAIDNHLMTFRAWESGQRLDWKDVPGLWITFDIVNFLITSVIFSSWVTLMSWWGRDAMKDYLDNPQIKYLAEIIDSILDGYYFKEQDWILRKTLAHLNHWTYPLFLQFKMYFNILKCILTFSPKSNRDRCSWCILAPLTCKLLDLNLTVTYSTFKC